MKHPIGLLPIALVFLLALTGCPDRDKFDPDSTIRLENMTDKDILFNFSFDRYPDTTLIGGQSPFADARQYEIAILPANGSNVIADGWMAGFEKDPTPVMLFLYARDTIDQVPWTQIKSEYKILKRYDLTKAILDSLNWTIRYK